MKVLEIGARHRPLAQLVFKDAEILYLDTNPDNKPDILADARDIPEKYRESFDGVFASHVLEHFSWKISLAVIAHWTGLLKPGGELHIVVPSLEWAAEQILKFDKARPELNIHLFGGHNDPWDAHYAGFTMRHLRSMFEACQLHVFRAQAGDYSFTLDDKEYTALQHYIAGRRLELPELQKE